MKDTILAVIAGVAAEEWRPLPFSPESHEVSSLGAVRHRKTLGVMRGQKNNKGYFRVSIRHRPVMVHRQVLAAFRGPQPEGMVARHLDGNQTNNRADNLGWGTRSQNQLDRHAHGTATMHRGERHPAARLRSEEVWEIRSMWQSGRHTQNEIARMFGVCRTTISAIINRYNWFWLSESPTETGVM